VTIGLSAASYVRILKVSRIIEDLESSGEIRSANVAEAVVLVHANGSYWT
jgi:predicted ATPase with chaperone activity